MNESRRRPSSARVPGRGTRTRVAGGGSLRRYGVLHQFSRDPVLALLLLLAPRALAAQAKPASGPEHPLVESVTFKGVQNVEIHEVLATLSTQPTTCRTFFLKPLCALTHSHLFEVRHSLDRAEQPRDVLRIKVYYWLRGYRRTQVTSSLRPQGRGVGVTFDVVEGPPTLIESVAVTQEKPLLSARRVRRAGLPARGRPINLVDLDSLETRVRRSLWDLGYANAEARDTALPLDSLRVALRVEIRSGPRTTVDTVIVEGNRRVTSLTIQRLVGLGRGDVYRRADVLEAQRRLYQSELFRQALIAVPDSADSVKKVVVTVREAPPRALQLGAGASTVDFGQVQANATLYNWIGSARRLDFNSAVGNLGAPALYGRNGFGGSVPAGVGGGRPERAFLLPGWQLSATMTQPWLFSTKNSLGLSVFSSRRTIPFIVVDRGAGASATFTRRMLTGVPVSLTYRYERTRVEAGGLYFCVNFGYCRIPAIQALQESNSISPVVVSLRADRTDDPLQPRSGYTARFDAEHASAATASDWRYNRIQGELAQYLRVGRGVLVLHANAGRVAALPGTGAALGVTDATNTLLHPRERFYAGGARSVRGYAEGQLGPRVLTIDPVRLTQPSDSSRGAGPCTLASIAGGACDPNVAPSSDFVPRPVGGSSLLAGTIEYRHSLGGSLGVALFVDGGRVGTGNLPAPFHARSAITPGMGVRYSSPIGPVRLDLGVRPRIVEDLPVVTQLRDSTGQLRLIQLNTPKRFDPTEGPHAFLGGITSRLVLHLYIGEAY